MEKILAVNQKIEIRSDAQEGFYKSTVQGLLPQGFLISVPQLGGDWLHLIPGMKVEVRAFADHAQYLFATLVLDRLKENDLSLYLLSLPGDVERIQLRDYVRAKSALDVFYREVPLAELPNVSLLMPDKKGITIDLSGGGLRMLIKEPIDPENLLLLKITLPLPSGRPVTITVLGEVKGYEKTHEDQPRYEVRLSFKDISERDREKIIAAVFQKIIASAKTLG
jgi:c-di-GMP-binding flagellar brake protein YcgR